MNSKQHGPAPANRVARQVGAGPLSRRRTPWWRVGIASGFAAIALAGSARAAGDVRRFTYHSAALGSDQVAQVYVPAGPPPPGGFPVLYLLHGLHGRPGDFVEFGDLRSVIDRMVANRTVKPLVVVMPNAANSWYVDSATVGGPGDYARDIGHDLPDAIEAAFPVGKDRRHRAIAGISMGGFGALRLALAEPERYSAVAALSPAIWQNIAGATPTYFERRDPATITIGADRPPDPGHFGNAFGTPFDPRRFDDANVFTLLQKDMQSGAGLPAIFLTVGDDDSHLLWRGAIAFFETMQANGKQIEFRMTNGNHDWELWKTSLPDAVVFVGHVLDAAAAQ